MKKLLVVSDVHNDFKTLEKILEKEKDSDFKIFAGDLQSKKFEFLEKNFDYYVLGNSDYRNSNWKYKVIFEIDRIKIFLTHGHLYPSLFKKIDLKKMINDAKKYNVNLIIHGHDHIKSNEKKDGIFIFNPGSTSFPRDGVKGSYGIITIDNGKIKNIQHLFIKF